MDIFNEKLFSAPYRLEGVRNDDFEGPHADLKDKNPLNKEEIIQAAQRHTLNRFLDRVKNPEKDIHYHFISAIDDKDVNKV